MSAGVYNFTIEQGAQLTRTFQWKDGSGIPVPLDGYTAAMMLREGYGGALVADWSDKITITGATGTLALFVPASLTAAMQRATGVYDIELTPPEGPLYTLRFLQGGWRLKPEATKP